MLLRFVFFFFFNPSMFYFPHQSLMLGASQLVENGYGEREYLVEIPLSHLPGINLD